MSPVIFDTTGDLAPWLKDSVQDDFCRADEFEPGPHLPVRLPDNTLEILADGTSYIILNGRDDHPAHLYPFGDALNLWREAAIPCATR